MPFLRSFFFFFYGRPLLQAVFLVSLSVVIQLKVEKFVGGGGKERVDGRWLG